MQNITSMAGTLFVTAISTSMLLAEAPLEKARPFLKQHCYACHGSKIQENELRFDKLSTDLSSDEVLEVWQSIVDQLNLGSMPP